MDTVEPLYLSRYNLNFNCIVNIQLKFISNDIKKKYNNNL